ncbi:MAG: hypothetical protein ACPGQL_08380 [Thermoplasmatota archaeon]
MDAKSPATKGRHAGWIVTALCAAMMLVPSTAAGPQNALENGLEDAWEVCQGVSDEASALDCFRAIRRAGFSTADATTEWSEATGADLIRPFGANDAWYHCTNFHGVQCTAELFVVADNIYVIVYDGGADIYRFTRNQACDATERLHVDRSALCP